MGKRFSSIQFRAAMWLAVAFVAGSGMSALALALIDDPRAWLLALPPGLLLAVVAARLVVRPWTRLLRALAAAVASYRDGDYTVSMVSDREDEFGRFLQAQNEFVQALREQRKKLVERELLLDSVVQNTPLAMLLVDANNRVIFANLAARQLFTSGIGMDGADFRELLKFLPPAVQASVESGQDALTTITLQDGQEEVFHVSQRRLSLQGRPCRMHLFRRMTRELSRQEATIWKKVIRVITHEINNSLAPISSMAHSGAELARRGDSDNLASIFDKLRERAEHLHSFINGYSRLAKLPAPNLVPTRWADLIDSLSSQIEFTVPRPLPDKPANFDRVQIEQALINLIKNAHESGSPPEDVELSVQYAGDEFRIEIADRGTSMNDTVLANALLPFYSTKRSGTGLGLALTREIIEAHGGRIQLVNRPSGGTAVLLLLPHQAQDNAAS